MVCALEHRSAWELTVATILSAQTTDVRVNMVTPELFRAFPTPKALAEAPVSAVEEIIKSTGFYHNKTKSIQGAARVLLERFGGEVPQTMDEMLELPGVARKTANVVLGSWFGIPSGVVVDTHVLRLSRRLELTKEDDPVKVEQDLMKLIPRTAGSVLPRADPPRPAGLRSTQAAMCGLLARAPVQLGGQDVELALGIPPFGTLGPKYLESST